MRATETKKGVHGARQRCLFVSSTEVLSTKEKKQPVGIAGGTAGSYESTQTQMVEVEDDQSSSRKNIKHRRRKKSSGEDRRGRSSRERDGSRNTGNGEGENQDQEPLPDVPEERQSLDDEDIKNVADQAQQLVLDNPPDNEEPEPEPEPEAGPSRRRSTRSRRTKDSSRSKPGKVCS